MNKITQKIALLSCSESIFALPSFDFHTYIESKTKETYYSFSCDGLSFLISDIVQPTISGGDSLYTIYVQSSENIWIRSFVRLHMWEWQFLVHDHNIVNSEKYYFDERVGNHENYLSEKEYLAEVKFWEDQVKQKGDSMLNYLKDKVSRVELDEYGNWHQFEEF